MGVLLSVGTKKGLFLLRSDADRKKWELEGPLLPGWPVYHAIVDPRDGVLYAATNSFIYGGTVHRSSDLGQSWERAEELGLPEESGLKLNATWHVEPGKGSELWLGGDPGVLFRSDDGGVTWNVNRGLLEHPTRENWQPGAGGMCCHSIQVVDGTIYIAISAAGAFRSEDSGDSWTPINKDVAADFHPEKYPEVGQCVHKLLAHPARPDRLWQQNHCGVYRSDDRGDNWERLDGNGLPSDFGFALALDAEAGGKKRFELDAGTVGEALRQLPVANLLLDEAGQLRRLVNVFVDGVDVRGGRLLDEPLGEESEIRIVGAIAGG